MNTLLKKQAKELRVLARSLSVLTHSTISIQITQTIQQIELLDSQLDKIEAEMTDIMKFNDSVIMRIPGIGYINAGMILSKIGDIHRFSNPNKLLAFAGLDPSVYQSGNFQAKTTRISKRGSRVFRYTLVNAAWNVVRNNATITRLIMMPRELKAGLITMHLGTVPANLSESSRRCLLTI